MAVFVNELTNIPEVLKVSSCKLAQAGSSPPLAEGHATVGLLDPDLGSDKRLHFPEASSPRTCRQP